MDGIIAVDKPEGITSFNVVARLRRLTGEHKVGHSGTLDPLATGVLPVFFGAATKVIANMTDVKKCYTARIRFGIETDTEDITGRITNRNDYRPGPAEVSAVVRSMKGEITQVPPMYSAVKIGGRRLYEIARSGGTAVRKQRTVIIYEITSSGPDTSGDYILNVCCSKGTYIRTLCKDIGKKLGCGATMAGLRRTYASGFTIDCCHRLYDIENLYDKDTISDIILPAYYPFRGLPAVPVTEKQAKRFQNGGWLSLDRLNVPIESGRCRIQSPEGEEVGLGEVDAKKGAVIMKCLFKSFGN